MSGYEVTVRDVGGGSPSWLAEVFLNGERVHARFASTEARAHHQANMWIRQQGDS